MERPANLEGLPLCRYCDRPFYRSHSNQRLCSDECNRRWRNFQFERSSRYRELSRGLVGPGQKATSPVTRAVLAAQDYKCAACRQPFPPVPGERSFKMPLLELRVWAPGRCLVCKPCRAALAALKKARLEPAYAFAAARLMLAAQTAARRAARTAAIDPSTLVEPPATQP